MLYENYPSGSDGGEYIELYNASGAAADISNWQVVLVNSGGNSYAPGPITIPGGTTLATGDYYVIGNSTTINAVYPGAVDLNINLDGLLSNGPPGGLVLKSNAGVRVDSISYRADDSMGGGTESANARAEGGTGRVLSRAVTVPNISQNTSIGRLPNGVDTGSNLRDFANIPPSPGALNISGITLPLSDNFNSTPNAAWHPGFVAPVRTATLGAANKPPADPSKGITGGALEVMDPTGGGDVNYFSGAYDQLNFSGYLWKPADVGSNGWSTGVGIATRVESTWLSNVEGNAAENGFYLEYQNGPLSGTDLKGGAISSHVGSFKFYALNAQPSLNSGVAANTVATELGTSSTIGAPAGWYKFRLVFDVPNNKLACWLNDTQVLYEGPIPAGPYNTSGGVVIGFREQHSGNPVANEATWVDNISLNSATAVPVGISEYLLE